MNSVFQGDLRLERQPGYTLAESYDGFCDDLLWFSKDAYCGLVKFTGKEIPRATIVFHEIESNENSIKFDIYVLARK